MKKLVVCVVLIMCISSCAFAATPEELINIIDQARLELMQFYPPVVNGTVLYEDDNVKMTAISAPYFDEYWSVGDDYGTMHIDVIIENYTNYSIQCLFSEIAVNSWTLNGYAEEVMANKKIKGSISIDYIEDTDLNSVEEIETIEGVFSYVRSDSWDLVGQGRFYWTFN